MSSRPDASGLAHGALWRAGSLASRVAFLLLIVPRTVPGEYGVFFSYSSIGLLLSRILSYGAIDHLPTLIRGNPASAQGAVRDLAPLSFVAALVTLVAASGNSLIGSALALALCMASGLMLAGAIRSAGPAWFERWLNLHPVLFLGIVLLLGDNLTAKEMLICQSLAILLSQWVLLRLAVGYRSALVLRDPLAWIGRVRSLLAGGHPRMVSDVLVAACIRAVAVGPVLFGLGAISDSLALALALGEATWTVGMILVHRNFAYYCGNGPDNRHSVRSAGLLFLSIAIVGVIGLGLVAFLQWMPTVQRFGSISLLPAFLFFAGMAALSELRYFDVASGNRLTPWVSAQALFVALAAFSPEFLGERAAMWLLAVVATMATLSLVTFRWRGNRNSQGDVKQ